MFQLNKFDFFLASVVHYLHEEDHFRLTNVVFENTLVIGVSLGS